MGTVIDKRNVMTVDGIKAGADVAGVDTPALIFDGGVAKYNCEVNIGAFASATANDGVRMFTGRTAVYRVYADDRGKASYASGSIPDQRVILGRNLITADQTGGDLRTFGVMGHLKTANGKWNDEQFAGVYGLLEIVRTAGTLTLGGTGVTAAVMGTVSTSGAATVNTNHVVAGVAAVSKLLSTLTQTGKTAGFYVGIYDTTNWSDGTARTKWKYGLYIQASAVSEGIRVGELSSSVDTSGVALSATQTAALRIHADTGGTALTASNTRAALMRYLIGTAISDAGDTSAYGAECLLKSIVSVNVAGNQGGVLGHFESAGTLTLTGSINVVKAGVASFLDLAANATVAANTVVSAFGVNPANFGTTMTGRSAIIHVTNPMAGTWGSFLDLSTATGCTQDSAATGGTSKYLKVYINGVLYTAELTTAS